MEDRRISTLWVVVLALLLLPVLYVGSYLALLRPGSFAIGATLHKYADYQYGGLWAVRFYYPAHLIDRRLRPTYWEDELWMPPE